MAMRLVLHQAKFLTEFQLIWKVFVSIVEALTLPMAVARPQFGMSEFHRLRCSPPSRLITTPSKPPSSSLTKLHSPIKSQFHFRFIRFSNTSYTLEQLRGLMTPKPRTLNQAHGGAPKPATPKPITSVTAAQESTASTPSTTSPAPVTATPVPSPVAPGQPLCSLNSIKQGEADALFDHSS
jgi:hypothetical protein